MKFNIPKRFTLGGVEHKVIKQTIVGDNADFGEFSCEGKIRIAELVGGSNQVSESKQLQTFFHEFTHAILFTMRKDDLYQDESFVNTFSSFLCEAINSMEDCL